MMTEYGFSSCSIGNSSPYKFKGEGEVIGLMMEIVNSSIGSSSSHNNSMEGEVVGSRPTG